MAITLEAGPTVPLQGGTGNGVALSEPGGRLTDDIEIGIVQTANESVGMNIANGWAQITGGFSGQGTAGSDGSSITAFWRRYSGQSAGNVNDSGDHQFTTVLLLRGVRTSGNPWEAVQASSQGSATTAGSATGLTTLTDGAFVLIITTQVNYAGSINAEYSSFATSDLASITEALDRGEGYGIGGALGIAYGIKTTAGAVGATTFTTATSDEKAHLVIAFAAEGAGGGGGNLPLLQAIGEA